MYRRRGNRDPPLTPAGCGNSAARFWRRGPAAKRPVGSRRRSGCRLRRNPRWRCCMRAGASVWRWRIWGDSTTPNDELREAIEESGRASARASHLAMRNLGTLLRLQGRYAESLQWLEKSTAASAIQPGHRGDHAAWASRGGPDEARARRADAARRVVRSRGDSCSTTCKTADRHLRAPICWSAWREFSCSATSSPRALQSAQRADLFWRDFDPENRSAGEGALWLGRCYLALGRHADARDAFARAQRVRGRSPVRAAASPKG